MDRSRLVRPSLAVLVAIPFAVFACGKAEPPTLEPPDKGQTAFTSDPPPSQDGRYADDGGLGAEAPTAGSGGSSAAPTTPDSNGDDPSRAIAEADILKVDGNVLYALSRFSGLSIIDITDPARLRMLGTHRADAVPFEMYVTDGRAYVMYNGWGHYEADANGSWSWKSTSRIQALDVSDPKQVTVIGEHDVPGEVTDSRQVGDILYLVTFENGYCWQCESVTNTRVSAFDVSDPTNFTLIDELRLEDESQYGGKRSIAVTEERIYISGRDWGGGETGVVDVVDISDPAGKLVRGDEFSIAGPIDSRWQLDEFEGVLRVISQPGGWGTGQAPVVQTFEVESSEEVVPLASLAMVLPPNESLRSVRFDGARAYAITFEQKDPLFTFDLSDPANPKQVGELVIPGWVYHMEPRGDRVFGLGFDSAENGGALHVSLFDVSDLATPTQLDRVNFGGDWANFSEDQDRIHKAFNIMAEQGLILVPFSGWDIKEGEEECSYGSYLSGIQLIDLNGDDLTLRGTAPQVGEARRGFIANGALFGLSDNAVQTFNIDDRDSPEPLGSLETSRNISQIRVMGDSMLRFGTDWWTNRTTLDFAKLDAVDSAEPLGDLNLESVLPTETSCDTSDYWEGQVLVHGDFAYVPRRIYKYGVKDSGESEYEQKLVFYVLDISDRTAPKVISSFEIKTTNTNESLAQVIQTESALLVGRYSGYYSYSSSGQTSRPTFSYDVISLEDPAAPRVTANLVVPENMAWGGFGYNVSGCMIDVGWGWYRGYYGGQALVSGNIVASQHQEPLEDGSGRIRYFLDRIDVSDPRDPKLLAAVNIPGGVVDYNHETGRTVTVDYMRVTTSASSWDDCRLRLEDTWLSFDEATGLCSSYRRSVNTLVVNEGTATLVDTATVDEGNTWASNIAVTQNRIFANFTSYSNNTYSSSVKVFAIGADGADVGKLTELGQPSLDGAGLGYGSLLARGERAFLAESGVLTEIDARDAEEVRVKTHLMNGYYCQALEVTSDFAYCALGQQGVQAVPLD